MLIEFYSGPALFTANIEITAEMEGIEWKWIFKKKNILELAI